MTNFFFGRGVAEVLLLPIELPHSREYWDAVTHIWGRKMQPTIIYSSTISGLESFTEEGKID